MTDTHTATAGQPNGSCHGCVGRGTGSACCMCGHPIPTELRRTADSPSELTATARR